VTSLPLLGRDPQAVPAGCAGVVNGANGPVTQGGLVRKDPYYIDGVNSSSHVWSGNPVNPNPDVIQEFKTLTNSFRPSMARRAARDDFHHQVGHQSDSRFPCSSFFVQRNSMRATSSLMRAL